MSKLDFVLSALLQLCHDSCARFDIHEAQHLCIPWRKAIKFSEVSNFFGEQVDSCTRAVSESSPSVHLWYSVLQREGKQMLVALCHSFAMKGLLLDIWLLLLDGRELCPGVSGGGTRGMSSYCCTSVVVMPHSQLLTVRSHWFSISWGAGWCLTVQDMDKSPDLYFQPQVMSWYLAAVHFPPSCPSNYKHLIKRNYTAGQCLQGMKCLCEIPMGSITCLFRQAAYKCEDFLIFYLSINQKVSKAHCRSALQRPHRAPNASTSLPSSASKIRVLQQQKKKKEHMCARDRGKAAKTRCSLANNLLKCWNRSNFLLSPFSLQGGALPSITWCAGPCCLSASWGPLLRQKYLGENEK